MPLGRTSPFIDPTIAEYVAARSAQPDDVLVMDKDPAVKENRLALLASVESEARTLAMVIYACLIIAVMLFQGGMALFYHSRRKYLAAYLRATASLGPGSTSRTE